MDELRYVPDSGNELSLTYANGYACNLVDGNGTIVNLSSSQGFGQIGESIDAMTVKGRTMRITGFILDNWQEAKAKLMSAFRPLSSGTLWWNDERWIKVYVKISPSLANEVISRFTIRLFAPYPFWQGAVQNKSTIGVTVPEFHFIVNYAQPHRFGTTNRNSYVNMVNSGNIDTPIRVDITAVSATVTNPSILNMNTGERTTFNKVMAANSTIRMYTSDGKLYLKYVTSSGTTNIFDALDDSSDLFMLHPGDNLIKSEADANADKMAVTVSYYDVYEGVYYDGTFED